MPGTPTVALETGGVTLFAINRRTNIQGQTDITCRHTRFQHIQTLNNNQVFGAQRGAGHRTFFLHLQNLFDQSLLEDQTACFSNNWLLWNDSGNY